MASRGVIRNRLYAQQIRDFRGLRFPGSITPTDLDAFIDFQDRLFIFIESKFKGVSPPYGQLLALERLCDACEQTGRMSVLLLLEHNTEPGADLDYASLIVSRYRTQCRWHTPKTETTCRQAIEIFRDKLSRRQQMPEQDRYVQEFLDTVIKGFGIDVDF